MPEAEKQKLGFYNMLPNKEAVKETAGQFGRIVKGRIGGELTSFGASLAAIGVADKLAQMGPLAPLQNTISSYIVKPNLSYFRDVGDNAPSFQTSEDTKRLNTQTPDEQSNFYSKMIMDYSFGFAGSFAGQLWGQEYFDKLANVPEIGTKNRLKITAVDRGTQLGVMVLMNTFFSKQSVQMQKDLAGILQKQFGMDENTSRERANFIVNTQVTNAVGAVAGIVAHHNFSKGLVWK